jgi:hypothetical protein
MSEKGRIVITRAKRRQRKLDREIAAIKAEYNTRPEEAIMTDEPQQSLREQIAENIEVYRALYGSEQTNEGRLLAYADRLIQMFRESEGREPNDYLEIENWSRDHLDQTSRLYVLQGKAHHLRSKWSGRLDLNQRPTVPQTVALTGLRYAPPSASRHYQNRSDLAATHFCSPGVAQPQESPLSI